MSFATACYSPQSRRFRKTARLLLTLTTLVLRLHSRRLSTCDESFESEATDSSMQLPMSWLSELSGSRSKRGQDESIFGWLRQSAQLHSNNDPQNPGRRRERILSGGWRYVSARGAATPRISRFVVHVPRANSAIGGSLPRDRPRSARFWLHRGSGRKEIRVYVRCARENDRRV